MNEIALNNRNPLVNFEGAVLVIVFKLWMLPNQEHAADDDDDPWYPPGQSLDSI